MLESKLSALQNLQRLRIPVILDVTVMKGVNEDQIGKIFDYALDNPFIKGITYIGYFSSRSSTRDDSGLCLMPDDIIDILQLHTRGRLNIRNINRFQMLLYNYMSLFEKRICLYLKYYWIFRRKGAYLTVDNMIDLESLEPALNSLKGAHGSKRKLRQLCMLLKVLFSLLSNPRFVLMVKEWFLMIGAHLFWGIDHNAATQRMLQLDFSTGCDPYRIDSRISPHCSIGYIYKDKNNNLMINASSASVIKALHT